MTDNLLYYGDNLDVLHRHVPDASVDLVYLDPPFNSNATYNVLFGDAKGERSAAQIQAFDDTWHWDSSAAAAFDQVLSAGGQPAEAMRAFQMLLGNGDMLAYLSMMAPRLMELRRVLRPTGSIYLHCDPTASHYLKVLMDAVFGPEHFRNEISWRRTNPKSNTATNFANSRDVLLRYSKTDVCTFNPVFGEHDPEYVDRAYRYRDAEGRRYRLLPLLNPNKDRPNLTYEFMGVTRVWRWTRERMERALADGLVVQTKPGAPPQYKLYLEDSHGRTVTTDWHDIKPITSHEMLGYPTQKPEALLERIIAASSNAGDVVLDPFCGCGTAVVAAQHLGRRWIGIDITHLAVNLVRTRLRDTFGDAVSFKVVGEPTTTDGAQDLADSEPWQFQVWALGLVGARPAELKKGADKGIDGRLYFRDSEKGSAQLVVISVKAGKLHAPYVRDLVGVVNRDAAAIGVLVSMQEPTRPMREEAASAGFYESPWGTKHPRVQLLTVAELLDGRGIDYPARGMLNVTYKRAPREVKKVAEEQQQLDLDET